MKDQYSTYLCKPSHIDKIREYIGRPLFAATRSVTFNALADEIEEDGFGHIVLRVVDGVISDIVINKKPA
jgi:hypothetical protein